jgi:glycosyltransferase involved in cell wall biosynthesis
MLNLGKIKYFARTNDLRVVAPVPYFPKINISEKWYRYTKVAHFEHIDGLPVWHPKYFILPKLSMSFYGEYMYWSTRRLIEKLDSEYNFEAIDAHYVYPDGYAAAKLAKRLKKPLVISARGTDINLYAEIPLVRKKLLSAMQYADRLIAVSQSLKDRMCTLGINEDKIEVIPNGVDFDKFYQVDKKQARQDLSLPMDRKIIFSVGLLTDRKGFHFLIDAMALLKKKHSKADLPLLLIIGEGERRAKLEAQVQRLDLVNHVRLVGAVPHNELYNYYNASDVFTLVSSREGWPNAVMEALACGIPVVATSIWGIPEIIKSEDYGILVEKQDPALICEGLYEALSRSWDRNKILTYSRQFDWNDVANKVANLLKQVI